MAREIALQRYDDTQKKNYSINRIVRIPVAVVLFISLISGMPMLYDRTLNAAYAVSEGPTATFGPEINLSKDLPPLYVADDIDYDNFAVSSDGQNVYVVWGADGNAFFRVSHDGGATFEPAIILNAESDKGFSPRVVSSSNHVYVEFMNYHEGHTSLLFRASHNNGNTFDAAIDFGSYSSFGPLGGFLLDGQMIVSGSNVYLTWIRVVSPCLDCPVDGHVFFISSHDNGTSFDPLISLHDFTTLDEVENPRVAALGSDVFVTWDISLRVSHDYGTTFDPIKTFESRFIENLASSGSNVYLAFSSIDNSGNDNLFFRSSHDSGASFDDEINLGTIFFLDHEIEKVQLIAQESSSAGNDDVFLAYTSLDGIHFRTSHDGGTTFDAPVTLGSGSQVQMPKSGSNIYVVWRTADAAKILLRISNDRGTTFGPATEVFHSSTYLNIPKLAVSSANNNENFDKIFVTWQNTFESSPYGDLLFKAGVVPTYNLNLFEGSNSSDLVLDLGQEVKAIAATNDRALSQVTFRLINQSGDTVETEIVPLSSTGLAESRITPGEVGTWTVYADFSNGIVKQQTFDVRLLVIPESPIGLIALVVSSFAALGAYMKFRPKVQLMRDFVEDVRDL